MIFMKRTLTLMAAISVALGAMAAPKDYTLSSPDGNLTVRINAESGISWSLYHGETCLLEPSAISMTLDDGTVYGTGKFRTAKGSEDDNNSLTFRFKECDLIFKAFDNGVAYRFVSRSKTPFKVVSEQATFALPEDQTMYVPYVRDYSDVFESQFRNSFENTYSHIRTSEWDKARLAFLPLLVEASNGMKLCIMETDLVNYPGMYLYNGNADTSLEGVFAPYPAKMEQGGYIMLQMVVTEREDYIAKYDGATSFPWRIVAVSEEDKDLLANRLTYRLATPAAEDIDYSWVKPGKVAWDWWNAWNLTGVDFKTGVNNETYKYYIDFASGHGIEYVILDDGWSETGAADLMKVVPEIDLEELVAYAAERNVGIILWAGYWAFDRDMEEVCPDAWFLNYTNPMGILSGYMERYTGVKTVGLCHSVQVCSKTLLEELGMEDKLEGRTETIAGINHMAWLLKIQDKDGNDLYPEIRKRAAEKNEKEKHNDMVRFEYIRRLGYYCTESSEHNAEYNPFFIKEKYPELIDQYNIPLDEYPRRCIQQIQDWGEEKKKILNNGEITHERSREYASYIMEAMVTNEPYKIGGNVINTGLIDNLPSDACVEVPCLIDGSGVTPCHVGRLPVQLAAMNMTNINTQLLTIEAARTRKREAIYQAAMLDPHTAAELSIDDIVKMCDELIEAHGDYMKMYR